jgi:hypothetical protein
MRIHLHPHGRVALFFYWKDGGAALNENNAEDFKEIIR